MGSKLVLEIPGNGVQVKKGIPQKLRGGGGMLHGIAHSMFLYSFFVYMHVCVCTDE